MISGFQQRIPDVWIGEDGNLRILIEVEAAQLEGVYVANQLLLEDLFIQTASLGTLLRFGEMFGRPMLGGTFAQGSVVFTGSGGEFIPVGARVGYDPGGGADTLYFDTVQSGTLPNPGIPIAPIVEDLATTGNLSGTYEWGITFITNQGETVIGASSEALILSTSQANISAIPLGGPGTLGRRIYRSLTGGPFELVTTINNNTDTTYIDNIADASVGPTIPPAVGNASQLQLLAQAEQTGTDYNVIPGAIRVLVNAPSSLLDVTNPAEFAGGTDEETIDHFRTRLLNYYRNPQDGAPNDLIGWALEISGVESATVFPNDNMGTTAAGHVTVRIAGPDGTIPLSSVVDAVAAHLAEQDLANITIHVTTFTATSLNVAVTITPDTGFSTSQLTPNIQAAISDYINSVPVGGTARISGIIDSVVGLAGVIDIVVTTPSSNQSVDNVHKFVPGTITVS